MENELSVKVATAISVLRSYEPSDGYYLCYSGGKDSDAIRILASLAGVKHDVVHNHTTVDAPETVRYVRSIPNVVIKYPELTMWQLIVKKKMPPTRLVRYCCSYFKERGSDGRLKITGVRKDESYNRSVNSDLVKIIGKPVATQRLADDLGIDYRLTRSGGIIYNDDNSASRRLVESCYRTRQTMINPIIDWTDDDVWSFLRHYGCAGNPLYQCGESRIGCIGCPMQGSKGMLRDFAYYPAYRDNYIRAFGRMVDAILADGGHCTNWRNGQDVFDWWTGTDSRQLTLDDYDNLSVLADEEVSS